MGAVLCSLAACQSEPDDEGPLELEPCHPEPDPLVFLTGGPGQTATQRFVTVQAAFRWINQNRDFVLVDQHGTGGSNPLRCPALDGADLWLMKGDALQWVEDCLATFAADPRFYTTAIAMEALDEILEIPGYDAVNLYGVSYGTCAALSHLRQFPDRVRAVILDGVTPPTELLGFVVRQYHREGILFR